MNTCAFALLTLSTLLFALTTKLPLASAETVLDLDGEPLLTVNKYYIVSAIWGAGGGGLYNGKTGNSTCPVSVLQHGSDLQNGIPVVFKKIETGSSEITTTSPVDISFIDEVKCAESSKWVVVDSSWVGIGGSQDHPGQNLLTGEFKIHKQSIGAFNAYNFVFYANDGVSFLIGRKFDESGRRLGVVDEPTIPFVFMKYSDSNRLSSIV